MAACLGFAVSTVIVAGNAEAFCRSSTCKGKDCKLDEDGCPADGKKLFWDTSCVGFNFDVQTYSGDGEKLYSKKLDPVKASGAIRKAFYEWSSIECPDGSGAADMRFVELEEVSCRRSEYNSKGPNVNVVLFQDDLWKYRGEDNTLAKTTVTFDPNTGQILDADIEINAAINPVTVVDPKDGEDGFDPRVKYDLQSLMTHEIGHFLGIAHSPYPDATMFASYTQGTVDLRSISDDDREAICAAYPPGRRAFCDPQPRGGLMTECAPPIIDPSEAGEAPAETPAEEGMCSYRSRGAAGGAPDSRLLWPSAMLLFFGLRRRRRPALSSP